MYTGGDVSSYKIRHGQMYKREDADGRTHVLAHAGASATANVPKVLLFHASASNPLVGVGLFATAVMDTGLSSISASIYSQKMYVGIPATNVPSDTDGWFQIGGVYTGVQLASSVDEYINCAIFWKDAGFLCSVSGALNPVAATENGPAVFAVSLSSVSQGTYDWYLLGCGVCGVT